jgi:hypothetical protein
LADPAGGVSQWIYPCNLQAVSRWLTPPVGSANGFTLVIYRP